MTAAELKDALDLELAAAGEAGALGNMQRDVTTSDHEDEGVVDAEVRLLFSWDSKVPVIVVQLGASYRPDADPRACARDLVRALLELALASDPVAKRFRRRARRCLAT